MSLPEQKSEAKYEIGDVYYVDFPYEESSLSKPRPAAVMNDDTLAFLYITSQEPSSKFSIEIKDLKQAGLKKPSWARIDKVVPIDEYRIFSRTGELSDRDFEKIFSLYIELIKVGSENMLHPFSLLAIKNSNNEILQYYDLRWSCWLFPNFRTKKDNKVIADEFASKLLDQKVITQFVTKSYHPKYSVSDDKYKIYEHMLYKFNLDSVPEHMKEKEFEINGIKYRWMSFSEMESNAEIMEKNEEVVAFVKKNCK